MTKQHIVIDPLIGDYLFRKQENWKHAQFILETTGIKLGTMRKAAAMSHLNEFHNFGHALGSAATGIRIAIAQGLPQQDVSLIALALLFHDALHGGVVDPNDEIHAFDALKQVVSPAEINSLCNLSNSKFLVFMHRLILATKFSEHGKTNDIHERIMQDADLGHLGYGPVYWLWASMGLIAEFNRQRATPLTPFEFIRNVQPAFVKSVVSHGKGNFYLTEGARIILQDPTKHVDTLVGYNDAQIQFAYRVRHDDITLDQFKAKIATFA